VYEDNIKMYLKDIGWESGEWFCLTEDRDEWWAVVNMGMNCSIKCGEFID